MKYWLIAVSSAVRTSLSSSMISGVDCMVGRLPLVGGRADGLDGLEEFDRDGEDDRGVLLGRDLDHGLELTELEGAGRGGHHGGGLAELHRRLKLTLARDALG